MLQRYALASLSCALALAPLTLRAQELAMAAPGDPATASGPADIQAVNNAPEGVFANSSQAPCSNDPDAETPCPVAGANRAAIEADTPKPRHRLFPIGGNAAIARGYRIPEPWGLGMLMVWNRTSFDSQNLSAAVSKGSAPASDVNMAPLPFVTTSKLEGDNRMLGFKADLWLFPGVNLFTSIGKVRGTNRIDVDIDVDAFAPFPFCRPAKPCGTVNLPIETKVSNTTVTLGTILVYGNEHWFVLGSLAKTVSISSKERSDVKSTNIGLRAGPRFRLGEDTYFAPYFGGNYFDLDTTVQGVVASGPVFDDGDPIYLRYKVDMETKDPFALVAGFNVELGRHLSLQAELEASQTSTRILASTGVRF